MHWSYCIHMLSHWLILSKAVLIYKLSVYAMESILWKFSLKLDVSRTMFMKFNYPADFHEITLHDAAALIILKNMIQYCSASPVSYRDPNLVINMTAYHYDDVRMGAITSQITSLTIVYSIVYSDADQRKHQSSASLVFVRGIHRGPVNFPHKWPVTRKMFPLNDVIMCPRT